MPNCHTRAIPFNPEEFHRALLAWYDASRRDLPWRSKPLQSTDPYHVWLSEVMLQQTTVKAVIPYYKAFLSRWPTAAALGAAPRDEVLAAWSGLGYYSRARNLHACAQVLARAGFPRTESGLRKLPGIGAYTAAAIAAIAFDVPAAVVDGNVERVLARLFAVETPMPAARPAIRALAESLTPLKRPGDYAQAMMDLGATLCTSRSPSCPICPVSAYCSGAEGQPERFPIKPAKAERPVRRGDAFVVVRQRRRGPEVLLRRREEKGLLGGMMEVPGTEWVAGELPDAGPGNCSTSAAFGLKKWIKAPAVRHTFTHFQLELRVYSAHVEDGEEQAFSGGEWAPLADLAKFALPTVMKKAVGAGLEALGSDYRRGNAAKSASKVSIVERSARPSTSAGRK
jgi:A/G-specific adenine glycosylase